MQHANMQIPSRLFSSPLDQKIRPPNHPIPLYAKKANNNKRKQKCKVYTTTKKYKYRKKKAGKSMQIRIIPTHIPKRYLILSTHGKPIPIQLRPIPINPRIQHTSDIHQLTDRMRAPIMVRRMR